MLTGIPAVHRLSRRRFCSPSRHCDSRALHARQSRRFLESPSLPPPLAALRAIPRNPLTCSATGGASPQKHRPASRFPAPKRGRKPGPFLETSSLFPPPAALRLLYTVAALVIPASDKAEITAAASKAGRFFCLRQHFPAFHITRWKTLCIMWKTSRYVILWKSCENFAHPLCTAKVL